MDALSFSAKNAGLLPVHFTMWGWGVVENKRIKFLQTERNQTGVFGVLPIAVRQLSISPFISRSMALATSTLLYLEYLSNTDRGPRVTCGWRQQERLLSRRGVKQTLAEVRETPGSEDLDEHGAVLALPALACLVQRPRITVNQLFTHYLCPAGL